MCLLIPDDILKQAGLSEREALIEIACRLFDAERLDFNSAIRLAGLERVVFEAELRKRGLAVVHYTEEAFAQDLRTLAEIWPEGRSTPGEQSRSKS